MNAPLSDPPRKVRAMPLPAWGGARYIVFGGPYSQRPDDCFGFSLAGNDPVDRGVGTFNFPIPDFGVPTQEAMVAAVTMAVRKVARGEPVFAGCGWGRGRTGLFLACLAKAWGIKKPVAYVRENYLNIAVETSEQQRFVEDIEFPVGMILTVFVAKCWGFFGAKKLTREFGVV